MSVYVFRVVKPINGFDAPVGSYVIYRPGHPTAELQLVRTIPPGRVDELLKRPERLQLVDQDPPVQQESPFQRALRDLQSRESA